MSERTSLFPPKRDLLTVPQSTYAGDKGPEKVRMGWRGTGQDSVSLSLHLSKEVCVSGPYFTDFNLLKERWDSSFSVGRETTSLIPFYVTPEILKLSSLSFVGTFMCKCVYVSFGHTMW